ncbi:MAG: hypothetical protein ACM3JH_08090 [Acidithiobacillales bacterium]
MSERPDPSEAVPEVFDYIRRVPDGDIVRTLETQLDDLLGLVRPVSEEKSLYRYAPGKWSLRHGGLTPIIQPCFQDGFA